MKLPDKIFGIETKEAYNKFLAKAKEKPAKKPEQAVKPTADIKSLQDYVKVPDINVFIAKQEDYKGLDWNATHFKLAENGLFMPSPKIFTPYFAAVVEAFKGKRKLYDGTGKVISKKEVGNLYKHLTTDHINGGAWTWLDAKFVKASDGDLYLETDHRVVNNKLEGKPDSLDDYVREDCFVDLEFNNQGLPVKKSRKQEYVQGGNIYYWYPRAGSVARFWADSVGTDLYCYGNPQCAYSVLGVFACAEGTQKVK